MHNVQQAVNGGTANSGYPHTKLKSNIYAENGNGGG